MLGKNRQKDIFRKTTSIGPHRDDLAFFINNMNATFGSQGQHRSVVLSLKLAEIELMEEITREKPILLLDDVMSELDNYRQLQLLETISNNIQTFITTTTLDHLKELPEELKISLFKPVISKQHLDSIVKMLLFYLQMCKFIVPSS